MNELKNRISSALPHEFRTSLSGILGYSNMISSFAKRDYLNSSEIKEIGEMACEINDEGRRLHRLTENFLLYSQIQTLMASHTKDELSAIDSIENPREIIMDIVIDFASRSSRRADIATDLDNSQIGISFYHFYKIIYELLDNAIKFSEQGSTIEIAATSSSANYQLRIRDCGYGMSKEQVRNIAAYNQYDRTLHEQQGTGLGLFIAKLLTELNRGTFTVESCPNEGTTIILDFPVVSENCE